MYLFLILISLLDYVGLSIVEVFVPPGLDPVEVICLRAFRALELVFVVFLVFSGKKATWVVFWEFLCLAISSRFLNPFICIFEARFVIIRRSFLDMRLDMVFAVVFRSYCFKPRPRRSFGATHQGVFSHSPAREGHALSSRSWWLEFGGPWRSLATKRSPGLACVLQRHLRRWQLSSDGSSVFWFSIVLFSIFGV